MTPLAQVVVGAGGAASIDFSSISQDYESLVVELTVRGTKAAATALLRLWLNNDSTATNYQKSELYAQSTTGSGNGLFVAENNSVVTSIPAASATANAAGAVRVAIPNYSRSVFQKNFIIDSIHRANHERCAGWWSNTAAVTQITFSPDSGNFVEGSVATLYGVLGNL